MSSPQSMDDGIAKTWEEKPQIIRAFIEGRSQYEQLCSEVAYILKKRFDDQGIEYSAVVSRAKTLKSFAEKISRKQYKDPLGEITDFAGVRVVYLYKSDQAKIEEIIKTEFKIVERLDKLNEHEVDKFGYGALHFLVRLGKKSSGARYDDLKELVCEIQVRTVLQDAWAIIDHHLVYKQESDVPKPLRRKLNSLAGMFETADDQFDRIRDERTAYKEKVKSQLSNEKEFHKQELNLDTFTEFLKWRFIGLPPGGFANHISEILTDLNALGYRWLLEIADLLQRTEKAREAIEKEIILTNAAAHVAVALALENENYRNEEEWGHGYLQKILKYEDMVTKRK